MSPPVLGGPPHTRASPISNKGAIGTEKDRQKGVSDMGGVNRVFPPLDDLLSAKPDIDIHSPLRKIVQEGDRHAKSADTNWDFRRPDLALEEYLRASIIAVEIIPRHKDYPSLQADRGELHRLYQGLTKRIRAQHEKFGEVKEIIRENNVRNGVKSSSPKLVENRTTNGKANGHARAQSTGTTLLNGVSSTSSRNSPQQPAAPPKKRPPVQPKPDALHGKAIQALGNPPPMDLAARFQLLRAATPAGLIQDPRIRTQPILIPSIPVPKSGSPLSPISGNSSLNRPIGPREMPSVPKTVPRPSLVPLDVPSMPRAPDPIYNSPARNADSTATANLPSSAPRSSTYIGQTNQTSAPPISTVKPTPLESEEGQDYFTPAHSNNEYSISQKKGRPSVDIPESTSITSEKLYEYIKLGSQYLRLLLVDLRSRDQFDEGHIMYPSIICVEPLTLRHGVSGDELEDTLVINPDFEQSLYNKRHEFDLVVFYDQSSQALKSAFASGDLSNSVLERFSMAVFDYGYEKRLKRRPMLLVGGLDAWIDLLGQNSLQTSKTHSALRIAQKPGQSLGRVTMARRQRPAPPVPRRIQSRPLTKDEESKWGEVLKDDQESGGLGGDQSIEFNEVYYARTTDDFMRRYPEVSNIQESMISGPSSGLVESPITEDFVNTVPSPPTRPPPALPRSRSSGVSERGPTIYTPAHPVEGTSVTPYVKGRCGFSNPGNLCYLNSVLQILSATPFIRQFILAYNYSPEKTVPRTAAEKSPPPQLMVRNLKNIFWYMWSGNYSFLTPSTFHRYVNAVHIGSLRPGTSRVDAFGGARQHDAAEFLTYVISILDDETNYHRNALPFQQDNSLQDQNEPRFSRAQKFWNMELGVCNSLISAHMKGQFGALKTCRTCENKQDTFSTFNQLDLIVPNETGEDGKITWVTRGSLLRWILEHFAPEPDLDGVNCERCKCPRRMGNETYITYMPDYLQVNIRRFEFLGSTSKIPVDVELEDSIYDLSPAFLTNKIQEAPSKYTPLRGQQGPFKYEIYGVIHHIGQRADSGHYWATLRIPDKNGDYKKWYKYDDRTVTPCRWEDASNGKTAYIIMMRRMDSNDQWTPPDPMLPPQQSA